MQYKVTVGRCYRVAYLTRSDLCCCWICSTTRWPKK